MLIYDRFRDPPQDLEGVIASSIHFCRSEGVIDL